MVGDPAKLMLPLEASQEQYLAQRQLLGLDDPLHERLGRFAAGAVRGDFGQSTWKGVPALPLVIERLPATFYLTLVTVALAVPIALALGIVAALRPRSPVERLVTVLSLLGACVAEFWLGLMLILMLAVNLGWFRTSGYGGWEYVALPAVTLAVRPIGRVSQVVRASLTEALNQGYIVTARAKGLAPRTVALRHALKNAALPTATLIGDEAAALLQGAVVIETLFAWPGVGSLLITAIGWRDLPLIVATVFVLAVIVILLNLLVDISYAYLDPRVRYA
jgi:peptide/nickel transport system permease protein